MTAEERDTLEQLQQKGTSSARKLTRARILLKRMKGWRMRGAEAVGTSVATITPRQRFVESNLEAPNELRQPNQRQTEAQLIAVAYGPRARPLDLKLLATGVESAYGLIARETVRQVLKTLAVAAQAWCLPEVSGEFAALETTGLVCRAL